MNDSIHDTIKLLHCEYARERIVFQVSGQVEEFGRLARGIVNDSGSSELITKAAKKFVSRESYIEKTELDITGSFDTISKQPIQLETIRQHLLVLEDTNRIMSNLVQSIENELKSIK